MSNANIAKSERRIAKHKKQHGDKYMDETWVTGEEPLEPRVHNNLIMPMYKSDKGFIVFQYVNKEGELVKKYTYDATEVVARKRKLGGEEYKFITYWIKTARGWEIVFSKMKPSEKNPSPNFDHFQNELRKPECLAAETRVSTYVDGVFKDLQVIQERRVV